MPLWLVLVRKFTGIYRNPPQFTAILGLLESTTEEIHRNLPESCRTMFILILGHINVKLYLSSIYCKTLNSVFWIGGSSGGVDLVCARTSSAGPPTLFMWRCLPMLRLTHCRSSQRLFRLVNLLGSCTCTALLSTGSP